MDEKLNKKKAKKIILANKCSYTRGLIVDTALFVGASSSCVLCKRIHKESGSFCCQGCETVFNVIQGLSLNERERILSIAEENALLGNTEEFYTKFVTDKGKRFLWLLEGLWCPSCADFLKMVLLRQKGVYGVEVRYEDDFLVAYLDLKKTSSEEIEDFVRSLGYQIYEEAFQDAKERSYFDIVSGVALFCFINLMMLSYAALSQTWEGDFFYSYAWHIWSLFFLVPLFYLARRVFWRGSVAFFLGKSTTETLITLGSFSSVIGSLIHFYEGNPRAYYDVSGALIALFLLAKRFEKAELRKIRKSFWNLAKTVTKKVRLEKGQELVWVPVKECNRGDIFLTSLGEKVALSGKVEKGEALISIAHLTGEVLPKKIGPGDLVVAGAQILSGFLFIKAEEVYEGGILKKLLDFIEIEKESSSYFTTQITSFFVPVLFLLSCFWAFLAFFRGFSSLEAFLSLLTIGCPCALTIAEPLVHSFLKSYCADRGLLVKKLPHLLPSITQVVVDKTGTLTKGSLSVLSGLEILNEEQKGVLKFLSGCSLHPVSKAIYEELSLNKISAISLDVWQEEVGRGVFGKLGEKNFFWGASAQEEMPFLGAFFIESGPDFEKKYPIKLHDEERLGIQKFLSFFKPILLSGDRFTSVAAFAKKWKINSFKASCSGRDKQKYIIDEKKKGAVLFIGDGVNDALALKEADYGISFSSASEFAIGASSAVISNDTLEFIPTFYKKIESARKVIFQNFFWSLFYNLGALIFVFLGYSTPLLSTFAMNFSMAFIVLNTIFLFKRIEK